VIGVQWAQEKRFFYASSVAGQGEEWQPLLTKVISHLIDGTLWKDEETHSHAAAGRLARMGIFHYGERGMLKALVSYR